MIFLRVASSIHNEIEDATQGYYDHNKRKLPALPARGCSAATEIVACKGRLCLEDVFVHPCQAQPTSAQAQLPCGLSEPCILLASDGK